MSNSSNNNNNNKGGEYAAVPTAEASLVPNVQVEAKKLSVQVTAPSDLQQGFALNVRVDGKPAVVIVPRGGVSAGESFVGPVEFVNASDQVTATRGVDGIPVGEWRTGLCDCCTYGFLHPLWIMTWCYAALPLAQVQTRLQLGLCGDERPSNTSTTRSPSAFRIGFMVFAVWMASVRGLQALFKVLAPEVPTMTTSTVVEYQMTHVNESVLSLGTMETIFDVFVVAFLMGSALYYQCFLDSPHSFRFLLGTLFLVTIGMDSIGFVVGFVAGFQDGLEQGGGVGSTSNNRPEVEYVTVPSAARTVAMLHQLLLWGMRIFIIVAGTKTRSFLRRKYAIPGDDCTDCCCMVWCPCCTVIQMSNHTANYRETPMDYGAEDGLQQQQHGMDDDDDRKDHYGRGVEAIAMPVVSSMV